MTKEPRWLVVWRQMGFGLLVLDSVKWTAAGMIVLALWLPYNGPAWLTVQWVKILVVFWVIANAYLLRLAGYVITRVAEANRPDELYIHDHPDGMQLFEQTAPRHVRVGTRTRIYTPRPEIYNGLIYIANHIEGRRLVTEDWTPLRRRGFSKPGWERMRRTLIQYGWAYQVDRRGGLAFTLAGKAAIQHYKHKPPIKMTYSLTISPLGGWMNRGWTNLK